MMFVYVVIKMPGPDDFSHARSNALATGVTFFMPLSYMPSWALEVEIQSYYLFDYTRCTIELGMDEIAEGCVKGIGSGVHETRPGWMTSCE